MRIALLCVGDELLDGRVLDRNAAWIGQNLANRGLRLRTTRTVGDDVPEIAGAASALADTHDLLIVSGGLGPTLDDLTREALAQATHCRAVETPEAFARLEAKYARRGRTLDPVNRRQAAIPEGARLLPSDVGTADAFALRLNRCRVVALPGVPRELHALFEQYVAPDLPAFEMHSAALTLFGVAESRVGALVEALEPDPGVRISYLAQFPWVRVRASGPPHLTHEIDAVVGGLRRNAARFSLPGPARTAAEALRDRLVADGIRVAVAESCTGGSLARDLTDLPGASGWFDRGVVTYSNAAKTELLDVSEGLLAEFGAVSQQTAVAMATGLRARSGVEATVSVTGIAGPAGGTPQKPVGTVWFAACSAVGTSSLQARFVDRDRDEIRVLSSAMALRLLERHLAGQVDDLRDAIGVVEVWAAARGPT